MALIVEDGTGVEGANALITVEYADAYFLARGVTAWTGATSAKEAAIVNATDYIVQMYSRRFIDQPWPLNDDKDGLADGVMKACAEYALRALTGKLNPDPVTDDSGLRVSSIAQSVGPISETKSFDTSSAPSTVKAYPKADAYLAPYLRSSSNRVMR